MKHIIMAGVWLIGAALAVYYIPDDKNIFWYCIILSQLWAATGE